MLNLNNSPQTDRATVTVTDVDIPFWSLATLLVKLTFAAIPAAIMVACIGLLIGLVMSIVFGVGVNTLQQLGK